MATAPKIVQKPVAEEAPVAPKSKKKLYIALACFLIIAAAGAGSFFIFGSKSEHKEEKKEHAKPPIFLALDAFTVNLQPENGDQFLQVGMSIQFEDEKDVESFKAYMPLVKSRILTFLSSKKASEIQTVEGKAKLASDISNAIKLPFSVGMPFNKVNGVLFTSFVVQ